jgi:hypothetical protein
MVCLPRLPCNRNTSRGAAGYDRCKSIVVAREELGYDGVLFGTSSVEVCFAIFVHHKVGGCDIHAAAASDAFEGGKGYFLHWKCRVIDDL